MTSMEKGSITLAAPAKINWRLAVTGRRQDGYHELVGLMQSINLCDTVVLRLSDADSCATLPPLPGQAEDNLALRAWLLLKRELGLHQCLAITVEKRIPVGGGLGGGSSDAAAVLRGANSLLSLGLSQEQLASLGLKLGADVPFCVYGGLALATGIGEQLTPLPSPHALTLLLVNPGFAVPTARVFSQYKSSSQPFSNARLEEQACANLALALKQGNISAINGLLANDLAASARQLYPQIGVLEQRMREAGLQPLLSGSGGTVFALLHDDTELPSAQQALSGYPWFTVAYTQKQEAIVR